MMDGLLEKVRAANPQIPIRSVWDDAFSRYGCVREADDRLIEELGCAIAQTPIPDAGNAYVPHEPAFEKIAGLRELAFSVFGGVPVQLGYCNGRGKKMNGFEYHKCPEVNFSTTGGVLFLAREADIIDGRIDGAAAQAFFLPPMTFIELHPLTLHLAPCSITADGFRCFVMLEKGINLPFSEDMKKLNGGPLLFRCGKWMIVHVEAPAAKDGAYVGVDGQNQSINFAGID